MSEHEYAVEVRWTGNQGHGTASYTSYGRDHLVSATGHPDIEGSSDPSFRGDPSRWSPEQLFVAALSQCHMLWFLHLCAEAGVVVQEYVDAAAGTMTTEPDGAGRFTGVQLRPRVAVASAEQVEQVPSLHDRAHELCFIARSVSCDVGVEPVTVVAQPHRPPVDREQLRGATYRRDADAIVAALDGRDPTRVLQQAGQALLIALAAGGERASSLARDVAVELDERGWEGDAVLAEDLRATLDGTPILAQTLPVQLDELAGLLEGGDMSEGGYLDLQTGEVLPGVLTDPGMVGEDGAVDVDEDPDRWMSVWPQGSREGWRDMEMFAEGLPDGSLRDRLLRAIEGRGAFRRFRDAIYGTDAEHAWLAFSDERQMGRAREFLDDAGIRVRL